MKKVLFKESQQYMQGLNLYIILVSHLGLLFFFVYALFQQVVNGVEIGDKPAPNWVLILLIILILVTLWGSYVMKLETTIDQDGIYYRFSPIIRKWKFISKAEIKKYEIRKYHPILEYGGWGIKRRLKWGRAYNVSGNIGLQLYLNNGKKVLFGTQKPQAMLYAMDTASSEIQDNRKNPLNN